MRGPVSHSPPPMAAPPITRPGPSSIAQFRHVKCGASGSSPSPHGGILGVPGVGTVTAWAASGAGFGSGVAIRSGLKGRSIRGSRRGQSAEWRHGAARCTTRTMSARAVGPEDLRGVFAVPPLARRADARRSIDFDENGRLLKHMTAGGITRFLYGGNAFLYHVTLAEYEELLGWLSGFPDGAWGIPSVGPSYGRAMDQAALLSRGRFRCAMALPCADPRDARGLEAGLREVSDAAGLPLILYLKDEPNFGADLAAEIGRAHV